MASRGGVGIEIDLARVPQRETGMTPYEIMLSESQERMLLVAERGREREVFAVFHKWGLDAVEIGHVTADGKLRVLHHGQRRRRNSRARACRRRPASTNARSPRPSRAAPLRRTNLARAIRAGRRRPHRKFPPPARLAHDRFEALDHRAVRLTWCAPTRSSAPAPPMPPWCA